MTVGALAREAQALADLRAVPNLIGWLDSMWSPLGAGVAAPAEGTSIDRLYDLSGKSPGTQGGAAARPVYSPPDPGGRVVNYARNPSTNPAGPIASGWAGLGTATATTVYDATIGHLLGRSLKVTMNPSAVNSVFGRKWAPSTGSLPASGAFVLYAGWWVRAAQTAFYTTFADGVSGNGGQQGVNATNVNVNSTVSLTAGVWTFVERWWNVAAGDTVPRTAGAGGYMSGVADGVTAYSYNMTECVLTPVSAVGVRPTVPIPQSDPSAWPGRYAWSGAAYDSTTVTIKSPGGLYFDGVDDVLPFSLASGVTELTVYAAITALGGGRYFSSGGNFTSGNMLLAGTGSVVQLQVYRSSSGFDNSASAPNSVGTPRLLVAKASFVTNKKALYKDGAVAAAESGISVSGANTFQPGAGQIGYASGTPFVLHGLAMFSDYHDRATRRRVEALFARRYSTPLAAAVPA